MFILYYINASQNANTNVQNWIELSSNWYLLNEFGLCWINDWPFAIKRPWKTDKNAGKFSKKKWDFSKLDSLQKFDCNYIIHTICRMQLSYETNMYTLKSVDRSAENSVKC